MRFRALFCCAILCLCLAPFSARAQVTPEEIEISVVTFGPGPIVYERFGHVAIRVRADTAGFDALYDWGNFDFEEPNFIGKFVKGSLLYSMARKPTYVVLPFYQLDQDRSVTEQVLNLDDAQKRRLLAALDANQQNPRYLYDYYKDNCSTRVRDLIDQTVDGQLAAQWADPPPFNTAMPEIKNETPSLRWHTRRLLNVGVDNQVLSTLIDFCNGPRVDQPLSRWDAAFIPMELCKALDDATYQRPDGTVVALVKERRVLNTTRTPGNAEPSLSIDPFRWTLPIGLIGGVLIVLLARVWRLGFWIGAGLVSAFAAFGAIFFTIIILFTRHWVVAMNENYLQFSPASIVVLAAILVPRLRKRFRYAPAIAAGLSVAGLAITISPLTIQQNWPAVCFALPLHLAVWYGWKTPAAKPMDIKPT